MMSATAMIVALAALSAPQNPDLNAFELRQMIESESWTATDLPRIEKLLGPVAKPTVRVRGLDAVFSYRSATAKSVRVFSDDKAVNISLKKVPGSTDLWAGPVGLYDGAAFRWTVVVDDSTLVGSPDSVEAYLRHPDTYAKPTVPKGTLTQMPMWESRVFPGVKRNWWIYVPAQYDPAKPACTMVWQDGQWSKNYVPTSFDNLIHAGDMPPTIAIFLEPGTKPDGGSNRSFEYDVVSDQYSQFLLTEILPEVEKKYSLRQTPDSRAIAGSSSGAICAFTVAWNHPDKFGKVLSWIGSYVDLAKLHGKETGGDDYPAFIRKTPKKPLRIWLQDGKQDIENQFGSWWHSNLQMERALNFMGYDLMWQPGNGYHSNAHGEATLPTSLRWLWRGTK